MGSWIRLVLIVALVAAADQISKLYAVEILVDKQIELIPELFSLTLAYNKGAAFGVMSNLPDGWRQMALGLATVLAVGAVLFMWVKYHRHSMLGTLSVGFILGGAVGNIIDRARLGMVVDFLDVFWGDLHWPTFNLADSCICVGVAILLMLKGETGKEVANTESVASPG